MLLNIILCKYKNKSLNLFFTIASYLLRLKKTIKHINKNFIVLLNLQDIITNILNPKPFLLYILIINY